MAVTGISIVQSNIVDGVNLLSINNPLVFLVDVTYTGDAPEAEVNVNDADGVTLNTFDLIYYSDPSASVRRFAFIADEILRGYMESADDFYQSTFEILEYVPNITQQFELEFGAGAMNISLDIVACIAAQQLGDTAAMQLVYENEQVTYFAALNEPVYIYFYNNDPGNELELKPFEIEFLTDYDDYPFISVDNLYFTAE